VLDPSSILSTVKEGRKEGRKERRKEEGKERGREEEREARPQVLRVQYSHPSAFRGDWCLDP
jgi:hypothetical protein